MAISKENCFITKIFSSRLCELQKTSFCGNAFSLPKKTPEFVLFQFETWQHVYTAVTRAKKRVIIVAEHWKDFCSAVRRQKRIRQTTLCERVSNALEDEELEEFLSSSECKSNIVSKCLYTTVGFIFYVSNIKIVEIS
jgi:hypothetical protein